MSDKLEKVYRTMGRAGAWNIAVGIIVIITGVTAGVLSIVHGAVLLKDKSGLMF